MTGSQKLQIEALRKEIAQQHASLGLGEAGASNPHPPIDHTSLKAHLIIHELVEKQILDNDPPEVLETLSRLIESGMKRHDAIHLIGKAAAKEALSMLQQQRPLDREAYVKELLGLTP